MLLGAEVYFESRPRTFAPDPNPRATKTLVATSWDLTLFVDDVPYELPPAKDSLRINLTAINMGWTKRSTESEPRR